MTLRGGGDPERPSDEETVVEEVADDGDDGQPIVCVRCEHRITVEGARIEVNDRHRHVCVNPSGIPYDIGCFSRAPGCAACGPFEGFWSWFPGYSWQVALCGGCGHHLGWAFSDAEGRGFHGLVLARVRPA